MQNVMYGFSSCLKKIEEEGFRVEDWMELPWEEGTYVISQPQVTNILSAPSTQTVNLEEDETTIPKATHLRYPIEVQLVASMSTSSQPTYLLPSSIKSRMISVDLERIRTLFGIPDEYQLRVANPKERVDWRSLGSICFYKVEFMASFRFLLPRLFREFFGHFGISPS